MTLLFQVLIPAAAIALSTWSVIRDRREERKREREMMDTLQVMHRAVLHRETLENCGLSVETTR